MAAGTSPKRIMDISHPDEVQAETSSRPVIITNRPLITQDPMMSTAEANVPELTKEASAGTTGEEPTTAPRLSRNIQPLEDTGTAQAAEAVAVDTIPAAETAIPHQVAPAAVESETPADATAKTTVETTDSAKPSDDKQVNPEAVKFSETDAKRSAELEEIIASGKYVVPINATQRKRTKMITIELAILSLILALVLIDALLDVGMLSLSGIPHTHFFSLP